MKAHIAALALLPVVFAANLRAQEVPATPWYPLKVGTKWHYRVLPSNEPGAVKDPLRKKDDDPSKKVVMRVADKPQQIEYTYYDKTVDMEKKFKTEKIWAYRLEGVSGDSKLEEYVTVAGDGVYRLLGDDKVKLPPLKILKLPPAKGEDWTCDILLPQGGSINGRFTIEEEEIKVPAWPGTSIKTLHVSGRDIMIGAKKMSVDYWFAFDKGIIKQKIQRGTFTQTLELEKFEEAK